MKAALKPRGPRISKVATPAILDAAQAVFSMHGLAGASIRAIARRAGCDPALIYYHYANKEALFLALMERRLPPLAAQLARISDAQDGRRSRDRIWAALEAFHEHLGEDAGFRSVFRGQFIQGTDAVKDAVAAHLRPIIGSMRDLLLQGMERGELRKDLDPTTTAFFIGRMHMEILDLVPSMGQRLAGLPAAGSLRVMRRAWLDFLWRAISLHPTQERG
jgi:AcrR family transcriptional regulator